MQRAQTDASAYMCECNRGGAPYFDASGGGGFLNFWQFLFGSPLKQPSLLRPSTPPRLSLSSPWRVLPRILFVFRPRVDSPSVVAALSAVFRRRSGGNNARAVSQYRAIIYFRTPKGGMRAERESKTWDNYSMLPELLHHAGWILPVWLLKIIGSSHREEPLAL